MDSAMIHAETRTLLTDALTPPAGCVFENGVATTYSLDLVTLLGLPLHLAWLGRAQGQSAELDLLAIMEALRRTAGQLTVFCQRGRMQVPRFASPLLGLLEGMVHDVTAKHGGAFHPKVWLLKFVPTEGGAAQLRLMVLSRNLTDDRSWDVSLRLDGAVGRESRPANEPLRVLFEQTVGMSHKALSVGRAKNMRELMADMMRCDWELPGQFDGLRFHAIGMGRKKTEWLPTPDTGRWDELGVISPFVSATALNRLTKLSDSAPFLIARPEELDMMAAPVPGGFDAIWIMDEHAETSDREEVVIGRERGLHAKVFVGKRGWNTHLFVGSANATNAALVAGINVEFMAELIGKASKVGRPGDWQGEKGIRQLLAPYQRTEPNDNALDQLEQQRLEELRERLCIATMALQCAADENGWALAITGLHTIDMQGIQGWIWPITVRSDNGVAIRQDGETLHLGIFAAQDITSFTGFKLTLGKNELCFALNLSLLGAPENRDIEMLRAALRNRDGFVRYLLLLLGDWEPGCSGPEVAGGFRGTGRSSADGLPLFEMLARAFARDPGRLAQVSQIVTRIRKDVPEQNDEVMPPEFLEIWKYFELAMNEKGSK